MTASNRGSALVGSAQAELMKDWYRACFSPVENEGGGSFCLAISNFLWKHTSKYRAPRPTGIGSFSISTRMILGP